jgi:hypothetical protein
MDVLSSRAADRWGTFPVIGRIGEIVGTRELFPHPNYRLVYQLVSGA